LETNCLLAEEVGVRGLCWENAKRFEKKRRGEGGEIKGRCRITKYCDFKKWPIRRNEGQATSVYLYEGRPKYEIRKEAHVREKEKCLGHFHASEFQILGQNIGYQWGLEGIKRKI